MQSLFFALVVALAAFVFNAGCSNPNPTDTFVATSPDGARVAVASVGMRNIRVLRVSGGSVVRLREVFVPEGEVIAGIEWSPDGRDVIVTTRGSGLAVDTRTWRIEGVTARASIDATKRVRG
jgi:hypothetical protein